MWLEEVIKHLETVDSSLCRFISSVCIAHCIFNCNITQLNQAQIVYPLLRMLRIQLDAENRTCPAVSYLFSITSKPCR